LDSREVDIDVPAFQITQNVVASRIFGQACDGRRLPTQEAEYR
jgi:hypothetical protein